MQGSIALVTGAASGLGKASSVALAKAGATVYCADRTLPSATAAMIEADGGTAIAVKLDVRNKDEFVKLLDKVKQEHLRLDVLCNIAGIMVDGAVVDLSDETLDAIIDVNLKGVLYGCQAAARIMAEQGSGSIVNMTSTAAFAPAPNIGAYAMTKAAVLQLTRTLAVELGRANVRVNAVAPGFVPTSMTERYYRRPDGSIDEDVKKAVLSPMAKYAPMGRLGTPEEVAACVVFLASGESSLLTGQCLCPNGGVFMH